MGRETSRPVGIRLSGNHAPLAASLIVLWITVTVLLLVSLAQNDGHLVYDVDDPYIHMAIAKHLVQAGVWGVTQYEFSSSSSSILWPLLLALIYLIVGVNELAPFVLNVILASATLWAVHVILKRWQPSVTPPYVCIVLIGLIALTPLPAMVFSGHEHILHALVTILFAHLAAETLAAEGSASRRHVTILYLLAPLLTSVRFEGLFIVLGVCFLLLGRGRWFEASSLGILALLPPAIYGGISAAHGWFWLPNPVLLIGNLPMAGTGDHEYLLSGYRALISNGAVALLVLCGLGLFVVRYRRERGFWETKQITLALMTAGTALHMQLAGRGGWFYRHDAYLVAFGLFVIGVAAWDHVPARMPTLAIDRASLPKVAALAILAALLVLPVVKRGVASLARRGLSTLQVARATTNIYEQQYQMGLFLKRFYAGQSIAANDIGAITFLADVRCLDLAGLGTLEAAKARLEGSRLKRERIDQLARAKGTRVAIIYDAWFEGRLPAQWVKVGEWSISNRVSTWGETVSLYAVDPAEEQRLLTSLAQFASKLPPTVRQSGRYVQWPSAARVR